MTEERHYARAPITEAIIDLRIQPSTPATLARLATIQQGLEEAYPDRKNRVMVRSTLMVGEAVAASTHQEQNGYVFFSADRLQAFQARTDGFTFSRFAPYDRWSTFRDDARRLWEAYEELVRPEGVTRVAVRYINRLDLPADLDDFGDYLRTVPVVAPDLSQGLSGFLVQLQIPQDDISSVLELTEALVEPNAPDVASVVLDIDLYHAPTQPMQSEEVWEFLEQLRDRKNDVFEACITQRTRELIDDQDIHPQSV